MEFKAEKTAVIFKAFCDESRIRILQILKDGENAPAGF